MSTDPVTRDTAMLARSVNDPDPPGITTGQGQGPAPARLPAPATPGENRPPILSAPPDVMGLLRSFRRRWRLAVAAGVLSAAAAAAVVYLVWPPPKSTARAMILVSTRRPKEIFETRESIVESKTYQKTQTILITSRLVLRSALEQPGVAQLGLVKKQEDPVEWLGEALKIDFPNGSEILTISLSSDSPRDSVALVNAVADSYLKHIVEEEQKERRRASRG